MLPVLGRVCTEVEVASLGQGFLGGLPGGIGVLRQPVLERMRDLSSAFCRCKRWTV